MPDLYLYIAVVLPFILPQLCVLLCELGRAVMPVHVGISKKHRTVIVDVAVVPTRLANLQKQTNKQSKQNIEGLQNERDCGVADFASCVTLFSIS